MNILTEFKNRPAVQLLLLSGLALFTELVVIRWLSSYVLYLGYFTNIILIASFFGLGAGALMSRKLSRFFYLFPIFLLLIVVLLTLLKINIGTTSSEVIYFQSTSLDLKIPLEVVAPGVFLLVALLFLPLGQRLGWLLNQLPPLKAYTWDVLGSLSGIALFTALAFLQTHPVVWFAIILIAYSCLLRQKALGLSSLLPFIPILILVWILATGTIWSPYYKLSLHKMLYDDPDEVGYTLLANSSGHQTLEKPEYKEFIYFQPYDLINNPDYERILIIGAGGGSDAAIALQSTQADIDAVDIDPAIIAIGKKFHPSQPYADQRVTTIVNDGRAYLETTNQQYDLIIFALTDSLTLASTYANTRLESYLFTLESFAQARDHLSENGLLVLYNFYREPWLVAKLGQMLEKTFNQSPFIMTGEKTLAVLMAGPGLKQLKPEAQGNLKINDEILTPATDDWPFLYLKRPSLPSIYLAALASVLLLCVAILSLINKKLIFTKFFHWHFFFLGAGFLLLETKNVINFSLLFGSTWLVNALVFFAILLAVLAANLLTMKYKFTDQKKLFLTLGCLLLLNLLVPLKSLLTFGLLGRYIIASLLTFSPIVAANLIFASSFRLSSNAALSFGANLLGAVIGGFLEYSSLVIGYHYLLILIGVLYLLAFLYRKKFIQQSLIVPRL